MHYSDYIPKVAIPYVGEILSPLALEIKLSRARKTKHGDYRKLPSGTHQISINVGENPYRFLITLIHEIAHYVAFTTHGYRIAPHGKEWKSIFKTLMEPLLSGAVFPDDLLGALLLHFKNPKASSDTDPALAMTLQNYDPYDGKETLLNLTSGIQFRFRGRRFVLKHKRRTRFLCEEVTSSKHYLIPGHARVEVD